MPRYHVTLANRDGVRFVASDDESLLDAATRAGVALLSGCRVGACRTCAARLISGKVQMPAGTSMTPELAQAHVVLLCVARAAADTTLHVGSPTRPLLHPSLILPWTD
jgi:ferredoxin